MYYINNAECVGIITPAITFQPYRSKLFKNLVQKLIALRAEIIRGRSASEKSYKIDSKSYRIGTLRVEIKQN